MKRNIDLLTQLLNGLDALRVKLAGKKHIVSLAVLFVIFVLAATVPLGFINSDIENVDDNYAVRAQLFADYWNNDERNCEIEKIAEPDAARLEFCESRFVDLIDLCRVDKANNIETKMEGSEYVRLIGKGTSLDLCRKWIQYSGDWNSWIDVCFDMNTGEVFYLYTSGECIYNSSEYTEVSPGNADAEELALFIADEMGLELYYFDTASESTASSTAVYLCGKTPIKIELSIVNYEGRLFSVKIVCVK